MYENNLYLGDDVFVRISETGIIILTTGDPYNSDNVICLDTGTWRNLIEFVKHIEKQAVKE